MPLNEAAVNERCKWTENKCMEFLTTGSRTQMWLRLDWAIINLAYGD